MNNDLLWQTKLAARIHDPAEKALVLLRDPAGHEGGSIVGVGKTLGFETHWVTRRDRSQVEKLKLPLEMERIVEQADRWDAAADRAQFPKDTNERYVSWAQVRFAEQGEIVHPLGGTRYDVSKVGQDVLAEHIKLASEEMFRGLIVRSAGETPDLRRTALAFWRFGPELGKNLQGIGHLWSLLPADTRTPDHTIWQHLDLTSALAGAMATGERPALLTVSIGPVQDFIAAGRSTSDLWAGSHFLSMLAWQAMKVIARQLGPDAILFPQLRGVPAVDLWLIGEGLPRNLFDDCEWNDSATDYNPVFAASLPNKFVALVPESDGPVLARTITEIVREWVRDEARAMLDRVLKEIGEAPNGQHCYLQLEQQLRGFPEVHWALTPWLNSSELEPALATFSQGDAKRPGLFGSEAWSAITAPIEPEQGWRFFEPNDGTLYPAVHDLGERMLGAAKSARSFDQLLQKGHRDSLTGEYEWLTLEEKQLLEGSPRRREDTLWARLAKERPSWAKKGEHLSAFGLIKRLWPTRYLEWLRNQGIVADVSRYTVSTHVMALAPSLESLMRNGPKDEAAFRKLADQTANLDRAALPRRLVRRELRDAGERWQVASKVPTLIDEVRARAGDDQEEAQTDAILKRIKTVIGTPAEKYYGLILMDGDRLGAWLSGENTLRFRDTFHTSVRSGLANYGDARLKDYLNCRRPASPARHLAISSALNGFSLDLVRHVVEDLALGKVLYAGGDDVMAMVCVRDLLKAMSLLRLVYSGGQPGASDGRPFNHDLDIKRGFVQWRGHLYLAMGELATASSGAVIAHHQAPLGAVMRELRAAESRAKEEGGRDAFSLTVIKRSGGALHLTAKWGKPAALLSDLRDFLGDPEVSRRAVYHSLQWLADLPEPQGDAAMLEKLLSYQFERQAGRPARDRHDIAGLARRLAALTVARTKDKLDWLRNFLTVAEFLARETRTGASA